MSAFWDERYQGSGSGGYEETWSLGENITGVGATIVENTATTGATAVMGWSSFCNKFTTIAGGHTYIANVFTPKAISFLMTDFIIESEGLADNQGLNLILATDATFNVLYQFTLTQLSGFLFGLAYIYYDGTQHTAEGRFWPTGTRRRMEFKWDNTNNFCAMWTNQALISTDQIPLSGAAATRDFAALVIGETANAAASVTWYNDLVLMDDAVRANGLDSYELGNAGLMETLIEDY